MATKLKPPQVLILGEAIIAQMIAQQLKDAGFDTLFLNELTPKKLPKLGDRHSLPELRSILAEFWAVSNGNGLVHPGTTIWAERPEFVNVAHELGLIPICPSPKAQFTFGNKLSFFLDAERLGIPHLVNSFDSLYTIREIEEFIRHSGQTFPFILKSVQGGGSVGLFVVQNLTGLRKELPLWLNQLRQHLGEVILFPVKYLEGARHLVVPFARFKDGRVQIFPISDASLQCRYRKVVEFCPAIRVDPEVQKLLIKWTTRFIDHCNYIGVGSLEFLVDGTQCFLIDGLSRLSTGFGLLEKVAGISAVSWQLATLELNQKHKMPAIKPKKEWSSGISARIYAEDSLFHFPQVGKVQELSSIRHWDIEETQADLVLACKEGQKVSTSGSGLLGVLFVSGPNREQLLPVTQRVLNEIWISGSLQTNERFLSELLSHPWVKEEIFHTAFVDEEFLPATQPSLEVIQSFGRICAECGDDGNLTSRWIIGEQWKQSGVSLGSSLKWKEGPSFWSEEGRRGVSGEIELKVGVSARVSAFPTSNLRWLVRIGSWFKSVRKMNGSLNFKLSSLISGRVNAVLFRAGSLVAAHEPLIIIESLGVFIPHALPTHVRVVRWKVNSKDFVDYGQELADIELLREFD